MTWTVYILECSDTSLYTGITIDLERRLEEHRTGRGAKYTKHRSPLKVRYTEHRRTKSAALTREAAIKSLARSEKLALIAAQPTTWLPKPTEGLLTKSLHRRSILLYCSSDGGC